MKIKGWGEFQHFKNRNPPWIKLYRRLINNYEWHNLDGNSAKILVMMWILAAESKNGSLPSVKEMAFKMRVSEKDIELTIPNLSAWIDNDDIKMMPS